MDQYETNVGEYLHTLTLDQYETNVGEYPNPTLCPKSLLEALCIS